MEHQDFKIGEHFVCGNQRWQVTDIGTRIITAIPVKEDWMAGPPYVQGELVFDEYDMPGCSRDQGEAA